MFSKLLNRLFPSKRTFLSANEAKIAELEKELAEVKAQLQMQSQKIETCPTEVAQAHVFSTPKKDTEPLPGENPTSAKAAYFDMEEYFCNGHDDTAVDVIQYDYEGKELSRVIFSWNNGCGEVTSEGIWRKAKDYAQNLINANIPFRREKALGNNWTWHMTNIAEHADSDKKPIKAMREVRSHYIWFSYSHGNTTEETLILEIFESCGVNFTSISLVECHDYDDREWYSNSFSSLKELKADKGNSLRLYDVNADGFYGAAAVRVHFRDWNIFGGVHIGCKTDDEEAVLQLLLDFEKLYCV